MKRNIKDYIGTKTAIWIDAHTIEQENAIKYLLIADGRITEWEGERTLENSNLKSFVDYCLFIDENKLTYSSKKYAKSRNYQIIPASEFLQPEFEYLQEIEVSNFDDFPINNTYKNKYLITRPDGKIVTWNEVTTLSWNYARKINHERTEAITTIKELMQKFNISKDEIS